MHNKAIEHRGEIGIEKVHRVCNKMALKYFLSLLLTHNLLVSTVSSAAHMHSLDNQERELDGSYRSRDSGHYDGGSHNYEFDHEAILGARCFIPFVFMTSLTTGGFAMFFLLVDKKRDSHRVMSVQRALLVLAPLALAITYYFTLGSVKEAEEYDKLTPEESKRRLALLLPKMDLNGDLHVDRQELKRWILNSFL